MEYGFAKKSQNKKIFYYREKQKKLFDKVGEIKETLEIFNLAESFVNFSPVIQEENKINYHISYTTLAEKAYSARKIYKGRSYLRLAIENEEDVSIPELISICEDNNLRFEVNWLKKKLEATYQS